MEVEFTALKRGEARLVTEIDQFDGSEVPVGNIAGIIANDTCIYITDSQNNRVYVLDRKSYRYKYAIGSSIQGDPAFIYRPYGAQFYQGNLLVGNSHGTRIFKMFTLSGEYVKEYTASEILRDGGFAMHLNNLFVKDSTVYIVKMVANDGLKVRRARLENNDAIILPEIVPIGELNSEVDSATSRIIIPSMYLLRSNVLDTTFFAIPSNKYLVNRYSANTGDILESISLLGIPELRDFYEFNEVFNNLFTSAAIDKGDIIYIPVQEIIDKQAYQTGDNSDANTNIYFVAADLNERTYNLYQMDKDRSVGPICFIDDRLWCYDFVMSKLLIYSLH